MMTCKQASKLISQSLDRPLSWSELMQLKLHLMICDACSRFKKQLNLLRVAMQNIRTNMENNSAITLPLAAKARIIEQIESDQESQ
ncbi:zf-HC2 domain-containing protein [Methylotenera sp.]|uniref:zf-HC2 domain-containing protein n=1 Tax=Methylotenera sp. TaxID=2051956 RepID=UPI002ED9A9F1